MNDDDHHLFILNKNIINESKLINQYYTLYPDLFSNQEHKVIFGTSGHRGTSQNCSFNEAHVLAVSQSIVKMRIKHGINGPCYVGKDTHILSEPAFISVVEVLTANCVDVIIQENYECTPTPVISHAIVNYNKMQRNYDFFKKADGIVITSSHNPPEDGGIKYTSVFGGPAAIYITKFIENNANEFLLNNLKNINRITLNQALRSGYLHFQDFIQNYVKNLYTIINMQAIKASGLKLGVDPLSGTSMVYWQNIAQHYKLNLTITNEKIDRTFSFVNRDHNGCIRIDCSTESTLTRSLGLSNNFDLFFVNDPDCDRHGIITSSGLMESSYYFAIVINYLFHNRPLWNNRVLSIGKTAVSSTIIDRIVCHLHRTLIEVPVGFKWFAHDLFNSNLGFAGEDSAGASFLNCNGMPWSTDKDGLIMCLLAAEIVSITNQTLQSHYSRLYKFCNIPSYSRTHIIINNTQKIFILNMSFNKTQITELVGDPVIKTQNTTPINKENTMSDIKIITQNGWVACRLSGTELIYKIYCESFLGIDHLKKMEKEIIDKIYTIFQTNDVIFIN